MSPLSLSIKMLLIFQIDNIPSIVLESSQH